jgi:hypothetical protein
MLAALETKLAALVSDALAARAHLDVVRAGTQPGEPQPGRSHVVVGLTAVDRDPSFAPEGILVAESNGGAASRRVLDVGFAASLAVSLRPQSESEADLQGARTLLMDDLSLAAHALGAPAVRTGAAFVTAAPDPGFLVRRFELVDAAIALERSDSLQTGELRYRGDGAVWPPGVTQDEGVIAAVDLARAALPLTIAVGEPVVATGATTAVRVVAAAGRRLLDPVAGTTEPLTLAVTVQSDLPAAERGSIDSGTEGLAGVRVVPVIDPETVVVYRAPAGDLGAVRSERIAVHLARPDGGAGVFLGSAAVLLREAAP